MAVDLLLLASDRAGSAEQEVIGAARAAMGAARVEQRGTRDVDELEAALDDLGERTLVVAGGDGSLHLVVSRLHARGTLGSTRLALVPLGTGNDLARSLGIPLDPAQAGALAATGTARPLDLLTDDSGGVVVNAAHAGVGAQAAQDAGRLKGPLGPLAYPLGALSAGLRAPGWRLLVEVDGQVVADTHRRTLMVGIGNGRGIGGGTPLLPDAEPDDGRLDVVVSQATGPVSRLRYGAALAAGRHLRHTSVRSARGSTVTISGEAVELNVDGELGECTRRRTWTVRPGAWSLVRP